MGLLERRTDATRRWRAEDPRFGHGGGARDESAGWEVVGLEIWGESLVTGAYRDGFGTETRHQSQWMFRSRLCRFDAWLPFYGVSEISVESHI